MPPHIKPTPAAFLSPRLSLGRMMVSARSRCRCDLGEPGYRFSGRTVIAAVTSAFLEELTYGGFVRLQSDGVWPIAHLPPTAGPNVGEREWESARTRGADAGLSTTDSLAWLPFPLLALSVLSSFTSALFA